MSGYNFGINLFIGFCYLGTIDAKELNVAMRYELSRPYVNGFHTY